MKTLLILALSLLACGGADVGPVWPFDLQHEPPVPTGAHPALHCVWDSQWVCSPTPDSPFLRPTGWYAGRAVAQGQVRMARESDPQPAEAVWTAVAGGWKVRVRWPRRRWRDRAKRYRRQRDRARRLGQEQSRVLDAQREQIDGLRASRDHWRASYYGATKDTEAAAKERDQLRESAEAAHAQLADLARQEEERTQERDALLAGGGPVEKAIAAAVADSTRQMFAKGGPVWRAVRNALADYTVLDDEDKQEIAQRAIGALSGGDLRLTPLLAACNRASVGGYSGPDDDAAAVEELRRHLNNPDNLLTAVAALGALADKVRKAAKQLQPPQEWRSIAACWDVVEAALPRWRLGSVWHKGVDMAAGPSWTAEVETPAGPAAPQWRPVTEVEPAVGEWVIGLLAGHNKGEPVLRRPLRDGWKTIRGIVGSHALDGWLPLDDVMPRRQPPPAGPVAPPVPTAGDVLTGSADRSTCARWPACRESEPGSPGCDYPRCHAAGPVAPPRASTGADLIAAERQRQMAKEGWTPEHDDEHVSGEMAWAAVCYAAPGSVYVDGGAEPWPWAKEWDKRDKHDRQRRLVIAGALIAAEIDRLRRLAGPVAPKEPPDAPPAVPGPGSAGVPVAPAGGADLAAPAQAAAPPLRQEAARGQARQVVAEADAPPAGQALAEGGPAGVEAEPAAAPLAGWVKTLRHAQQIVFEGKHVGVAWELLDDLGDEMERYAKGTEGANEVRATGAQASTSAPSEHSTGAATAPAAPLSAEVRALVEHVQLLDVNASVDSSMVADLLTLARAVLATPAPAQPAPQPERDPREYAAAAADFRDEARALRVQLDAALAVRASVAEFAADMERKAATLRASAANTAEGQERLRAKATTYEYEAAALRKLLPLEAGGYEALRERLTEERDAARADAHAALVRDVAALKGMLRGDVYVLAQRARTLLDSDSDIDPRQGKPGGGEVLPGPVVCECARWADYGNKDGLQSRRPDGHHVTCKVPLFATPKAPPSPEAMHNRFGGLDPNVIKEAIAQTPASGPSPACADAKHGACPGRWPTTKGEGLPCPCNCHKVGVVPLTLEERRQRAMDDGPHSGVPQTRAVTPDHNDGWRPFGGGRDR